MEAPAVRVLDAFTAGGAQVAGSAQSVSIDTAVDLDYVRGRHTWRTGVALDIDSVRVDRRQNYLGTYTFASLADYAAARPAIYSQRTGSGDARYAQVRLGLYVQDDLRVTRRMLVNYGLRVERQSLVAGPPVFLPRGSVTWSPHPGGRTVLRAGAGRFSDWIPGNAFEQTLLFDGTRQREVVLVAPTYPVHDADVATRPAERYLMAPVLRLPVGRGATLGVEHQATPALRLVATFTSRSASNLLFGSNRNPLVGGFRPDPAAGNVIEATNGAGLRSRTFMAQAVRLAPRSRIDVTGAYMYTRQLTNTTGAFSVPAGPLSGEWGASAPAHAAIVSATLRLSQNTGVVLSPRWRSGVPYTITTGYDDNGDGFLVDRPAGRGRGDVRTGNLFELGIRLAHVIAFGPGAANPAVTACCRLELFASAQNVTNRASYLQYGGVQASPFFGLPTLASSPRRTEVGFRLAF